MKILAIMGSPHRGNTLELTQRLEQALSALGDVQFEYVHLKDMELKPCKGCFVCFIEGEDRCPLRDDHDVIAEKMAAADGAVFVSPVFSMHVSYLFKLFVDRFAYNFHRPPHFGKYALVLAATGGIGLKETLQYLRGVAEAWGFNVVGELGFIAPPKHTRLLKLTDLPDRTEQAARELHAAIKQRRPQRLSMKNYLHFLAMRAIYSRVEDTSPVDHAFWTSRGWLDRQAVYFHDNVRGSFIKSLPARFLAWQMGRSIDRQMARPGALTNK